MPRRGRRRRRNQRLLGPAQTGDNEPAVRTTSAPFRSRHLLPGLFSGNKTRRLRGIRYPWLHCRYVRTPASAASSGLDNIGHDSRRPVGASSNCTVDAGTAMPNSGSISCGTDAQPLTTKRPANAIARSMLSPIYDIPWLLASICRSGPEAVLHKIGYPVTAVVTFCMCPCLLVLGPWMTAMSPHAGLYPTSATPTFSLSSDAYSATAVKPRQADTGRSPLLTAGLLPWPCRMLQVPDEHTLRTCRRDRWQCVASDGQPKELLIDKARSLRPRGGCLVCHWSSPYRVETTYSGIGIGRMSATGTLQRRPGRPHLSLDKLSHRDFWNQDAVQQQARRSRHWTRQPPAPQPGAA